MSLEPMKNVFDVHDVKSALREYGCSQKAVRAFFDDIHYHACDAGMSCGMPMLLNEDDIDDYDGPEREYREALLHIFPEDVYQDLDGYRYYEVHINHWW